MRQTLRATVFGALGWKRESPSLGNPRAAGFLILLAWFLMRNLRPRSVGRGPFEGDFIGT